MAKTGMHIKGLDKLEKYFKNVKKNLVSRGTFGRSALVMLQEVNKNFVKTRSPLGTWKPLKLRRGKPLQSSGLLKNSIQPSWDSKQAVVGTNKKYARIQDEGGIVRPKGSKKLFIPISARARRKKPGANIPKGWKWGVDYVLAKRAKIPARKFMWIGSSGQSRIINIFEKVLQEP